MRPSLFIFFNQSDSFLKPDFTSSMVRTKYFSNLANVLHTFFSALLFRIFLSEYCYSLGCQSFLCPIIFWKFCIGFEVNFMFDFVIYIDMVERVSSLSKILCMYTSCMHCVHVTAEARLIFVYLIYINSCYAISTVIQ